MADFFIDKTKPFTENVLPLEAFMEFKEDTYDVLSSVFLREMNDEVSHVGETKVGEYEYRFDNLSFKKVGSTDYWWFLMEYNNYIDWNIPSSAIIKIPSTNDIFSLRSTMVLKQNFSDRKKI